MGACKTTVWFAFLLSPTVLSNDKFHSLTCPMKSTMDDDQLLHTATNNDTTELKEKQLKSSSHNDVKKKVGKVHYVRAPKFEPRCTKALQ